MLVPQTIVLETVPGAVISPTVELQHQLQVWPDPSTSLPAT